MDRVGRESVDCDREAVVLKQEIFWLCIKPRATEGGVCRTDSARWEGTCVLQVMPAA